jgi:hypothetical protein
VLAEGDAQRALTWLAKPLTSVECRPYEAVDGRWLYALLPDADHPYLDRDGTVVYRRIIKPFWTLICERDWTYAIFPSQRIERSIARAAVEAAVHEIPRSFRNIDAITHPPADVTAPPADPAEEHPWHRFLRRWFELFATPGAP